MIVFVAAALASPVHLAHQARLLDGAGAPIDGEQSVTITLHDAVSGGGTLWTRSWPSVPVSDGYFTLMLEDGTPSLDTSLFAAQPEVWLEMTVGASSIVPRTPLGHVAFAAVADSATSAATASSVSGPVAATEVTVGGVTIIDSAGNVHGRGPTDLVCSSGESPEHDGLDWTCAANRRTDSEIEGLVEGLSPSFAGDVSSRGYSLTDSQNVRAIVTKGTVDSYCSGAGTAIHVPWSYRGQTGSQICAADARNQTTCNAVRYVYVTNGNGYGRYATNDLSCSVPVNHPWPWGDTSNSPNTLSAEWGHGSTWVVCCS